MTSRDAVFVESVSAMLKLAQSDPEKARVALVARGDQVLAALRDSMLPEAKDSERIVALIDLYVQATFAMLLEAARSNDRIVFGEAEVKAWAVAEALDRGAEGARNRDRDAMMTSMRTAEAILGLDFMSP
jgi:predicted ArsR family transcriptional regulator